MTTILTNNGLNQTFRTSFTGDGVSFNRELVSWDATKYPYVIFNCIMKTASSGTSLIRAEVFSDGTSVNQTSITSDTATTSDKYMVSIGGTPGGVQFTVSGGRVLVEGIGAAVEIDVDIVLEAPVTYEEV